VSGVVAVAEFGDESVDGCSLLRAGRGRFAEETRPHDDTRMLPVGFLNDFHEGLRESVFEIHQRFERICEPEWGELPQPHVAVVLIPGRGGSGSDHGFLPLLSLCGCGGDPCKRIT